MVGVRELLDIEGPQAICCGSFKRVQPVAGCGIRAWWTFLSLHLVGVMLLDRRIIQFWDEQSNSCGDLKIA